MGFSPYPWSAPLNDIPAAADLVRRAARRADVVIVLMHAGAEGADQIHTPYGTQYFFGEDRGNVRAFAHAMVKAGADLVFGSGPHVIRGIERYRDRLIAYSLGNFAGWGNFAPWRQPRPLGPADGEDHQGGAHPRRPLAGAAPRRAGSAHRGQREALPQTRAQPLGG